MVMVTQLITWNYLSNHCTYFSFLNRKCLNCELVMSHYDTLIIYFRKYNYKWLSATFLITFRSGGCRRAIDVMGTEVENTWALLFLDCSGIILIINGTRFLQKILLTQIIDENNKTRNTANPAPDNINNWFSPNIELLFLHLKWRIYLHCSLK